MIRELMPSTAFTRAVRRVGKKDRAAFAAIGDTLRLMRADVYDPRLRTHKSRGDLASLGRAAPPTIFESFLK